MSQPTPKKYFDSEVYRIEKPLYDNSYDQQLQNLYLKFFSRRKCPAFYQLSNFYSAFDALLTSGDTTGKAVTIPIEYKRREGDNRSAVKFTSCFFERQKYDSLLTAKKLVNAPAAFYIMEFDEYIFVYDVVEDSSITWSKELHRVEKGSNQYEEKEVTYLPYSKACYIIKTDYYVRQNYEQLTNYLKVERIKVYGVI